MVSPVAYMADFDGYQCLVFLHDAGHFSVVLVRPTADAALKALRFEAAFDAACGAIPALAEWTEPDRSHATSAVLVGGALRNVYRRQAGTPGLVAVGDSVATTTPTHGRGIAMSCMQVTALLALLDEGAEPTTVAEPFGAWCDHAIEPWVADHPAHLRPHRRRSRSRPRIGQHAGGYFAMTALPETLRPAEPLAGRSTRRAGDRHTHPAQRATNWWTSSAGLCPPHDLITEPRVLCRHPEPCRKPIRAQHVSIYNEARRRLGRPPRPSAAGVRSAGR